MFTFDVRTPLETPCAPLLSHSHPPETSRDRRLSWLSLTPFTSSQVRDGLPRKSILTIDPHPWSIVWSLTARTRHVFETWPSSFILLESTPTTMDSSDQLLRDLRSLKIYSSSHRPLLSCPSITTFLPWHATLHLRGLRLTTCRDPTTCLGRTRPVSPFATTPSRSPTTSGRLRNEEDD